MWCVQVDGVSVTGMSQPQVVQLLRRALGNVTLLVSRQETIDAQEEEEVRACLTNSCTFCIVISGPPPHFSSPLSLPLFPLSFLSPFPSLSIPSSPAQPSPPSLPPWIRQ